MTGGVDVDVVQNIFWIFPENRLLKFYNHQQGYKNIIFMKRKNKILFVPVLLCLLAGADRVFSTMLYKHEKRTIVKSQNIINVNCK